jgi:sporulation protein YlmC with PRC-barrel domain
MKNELKPIIGTLLLSAFASVAPAQEAEKTPAAAKTQASEKTPAPGTDPSAPTQPPQQVRKPGPDEPAASADASALVGAAKASELIGMEVADPQGEKLARVEEIAVDVESGRILQVILASGGFLGVGASETAVPPMALALDAEGRQLSLAAGKERLAGAPPFDTSKWSEAFTTVRLAAVYKHFGMESSLDFVEAGDQTGKPSTIPESRLDGVQRASRIAGMKVTNLQNETVGDVAEILLDLPAGRLMAIVVSSGEYLGIEGELSAVPATAFRISTDRKTLHLDTSKAALEAAPHFKADRWPDFTDADVARSIFASYSVEPYFRPGVGRNPRVIVGGSPDAGGSSTPDASLADMATTSAIRKEIRSLENVSLNARNVGVVTIAGRTTLSGRVDTAEEKEIIGEIADRFNRKADVENLLVVKAEPVKSE